jgi:protein TonB
LKRLLIAAALALGIHGFLLGTNFGWINKTSPVKPKPRVVTLSLAYRQIPKPKPSVKKSAPLVEKPIRPIQKSVPRTKPQKKPISISKTVSATPPAAMKKPPIVTPPTKSVQKTEPPSAPQPVEERKKVETPFKAMPKGTEINKTILAKPIETVRTEPAVKEAIPMYRNNPPPRYPKVARRRGYQGTVLLDVYIDKSGGVGDIKIFKTSGHAVLDKAAKAAVKNWLFEPGMKGEDKVAMWVKIPIRFQLK